MHAGMLSRGLFNHEAPQNSIYVFVTYLQSAVGLCIALLHNLHYLLCLVVFTELYI